MKTCSKCGAEKPVTEFHRDRRKKDGLRSDCKVCNATYHAAAYAAAPDKFRARGRATGATAYAADPAKFCARSRAALAVAYAVAPGKFNARSRAWAKTNPERGAAHTAKRKAAKLQATPIWASREKIDEFYYTANMLGMHTGDPYHVDHVVPLQSKLVCGLHCEFNMQVLTGVENLKKGNRHWPDMP